MVVILTMNLVTKILENLVNLGKTFAMFIAMTMIYGRIYSSNNAQASIHTLKNLSGGGH